MTILKFPDAIDFFKYLMEQNIHRYGIVSVVEIKTGEKGTGIYYESFRLSSIDDNKKEILVCDVLYFRGIFVTEEYMRKESKEPKKKMLEQLHEKIQEWTKGYKLKMLHCNFSL